MATIRIASMYAVTIAEEAAARKKRGEHSRQTLSAGIAAVRPPCDIIRPLVAYASHADPHGRSGAQKDGLNIARRHRGLNHLVHFGLDRVPTQHSLEVFTS